MTDQRRIPTDQGSPNGLPAASEQFERFQLATLEIEDTQNPVQPGSVVFVAAGVRHRFHSIASRLSVLVVFSPPET